MNKILKGAGVVLVLIIVIFSTAKLAAFFVGNPNSVVNNIIGAGAHSQSLRQAATQSVTSLVVTTSLQNSDSTDRVIDKVTFFASTTASANATVMRASLSSDGSAATTDLGVSSTLSSNAVNWVTTSTFGTASQRIWTAGSYVICYSNAAVTTTAGFCAVDYYKP